MAGLGWLILCIADEADACEEEDDAEDAVDGDLLYPAAAAAIGVDEADCGHYEANEAQDREDDAQNSLFHGFLLDMG